MKATLWVHDQQYSPHELILNSDMFEIGDLIAIKLRQTSTSGENELLLKAGQTDSKSQLQISIAQHIAQQFDLQPRSICSIRKIRDIDSVACSLIEIAFRDQYIGRADMWQLKMSLLHTPVYVGKKIACLGVRGQIKGIYINGQEKSSGYVTENTKPIFRSETAKFFLFVQMSKEMWEFDEDGEMCFEKCVYGFLPELFSKWKQVGTNHVVSIVMFARVWYDFHYDGCLRDFKGRYYKDFYRVIVDWESRSDWTAKLVEFKKEFFRFQKDILQQKDITGANILSGTNSTAFEGNILEAVNLALNPFDKHYIDRDLSRTGLSIVMITPGTGFYVVDKHICRMTTQRMIDNGVSLDLVCLSKPPLHAVPLFQFQSKDFNLSKSSGDVDLNYSLSHTTRSDKSERNYSNPDYIRASQTDQRNTSMDHLYTDDNFSTPGTFYMVPDWIDCSYWNRQDITLAFPTKRFLPRCKMYQVQMRAIDEQSITIPNLDIFDKNDYNRDPTSICNAYDQSLFAPIQKKVLKLSKLKNSFYENDEPESAVSIKPVDSRLAMHLQSTHVEGYSSSEKRLGSSIPRGGSYTGGWGRDYYKERRSSVDKSVEDESRYSTSIEPIRILRNGSNREYESHRGSLSSDSRGASPIPEYLRNQGKFSPSKTLVKQVFLRHNYVNPFSNQKSQRVGINDRRWEHIPKWEPYDDNGMYTNWKSLCSPACLPLTIEYFPSSEELSEFYQEYTYTVSPANDNEIESLLVELISQRLAQGFQLIVSAAVDQTPSNIASTMKKSLISISKPYYLCLGDHVHRLFYDSSGNNIEVKRYTRRLNYSTDPISYSCSIWSKHMSGYQNRQVLFSYPALANYNWNYLDHLISGYQDQMTDALRFWRIRFILIPLETMPTIIPQGSLVGEKLDEEEERLAGFQKFMEMIEKVHFVNSGEKRKKQNLDIQYTTLNLSSLVKSEHIHALLPEAFMTNQLDDKTKQFDLLSKKTSIEMIAEQMIQPPPVGLCLQDRHWHFQIYEAVATGAEIIDWILKHFADIETREAALIIANQLIDNTILEHVHNKHKLLDGFYFYRFSGPWMSKIHTKVNEKRSSKRFQAVKSIPLDMDPQKKSSRQEIALLHYDTTHNTKNCYHFQLHWLVCTARLVEDMLHAWTRMAEKTGFRLVEAPGGQANGSGDDNPFQALIPIEMLLKPPHLDESRKSFLPLDYFERELVQNFQFVLDIESDSCFPADSRGYSYQRKPWAHTQFVHQSGIAFIQILPDSSGFLWVNNRLHINATSNSKMTFNNPEVLRESFVEFCSNGNKLQEFWAQVENRLDVSNNESGKLFVD